MITMRQLAELAGVTVGTVSLALRDNPRIGLATRQRIQALAAEHHYSPDRPANSMVRDKAHTIGCILPNVTCTFYARLLRGVLERAFAVDYHVITLETHSKMLQTCKAIDALIARRVEGILIASEHQAMIPRETVQAMFHHHVWPVSVDSTLFEEATDAVWSNEADLASLLVEYLMALGHRSIAYLGDVAGGGLNGRAHLMASAFRHKGLSTAHFIDAFSDTPTQFDARGIVQSLLTLPVPPTAIICWEDRAAAKVMQELLRLGIRVPQDMSVVGCANMDIAELTMPPLTSVEQHPEEMGQRALDLILSRSTTQQHYRALPPQSISIPVQLIKRGSCGPCLPSSRRVR